MKRAPNPDDGEFGQTLAAGIAIILVLAFTAWATGCSSGEPVVEFRAPECSVTPTSETRDIKRSRCTYRNNYAKPCMGWHRWTETQHKQIRSCHRDEWVAEPSKE